MENMIIDFWGNTSVASRSLEKMLSAFGSLKNLEVS